MKNRWKSRAKGAGLKGFACSLIVLLVFLMSGRCHAVHAMGPLVVNESVRAADRDRSDVVILVGDSRTKFEALIPRTERDRCVFIYYGGGSYHILEGDMMPQVKKMLKKYPAAPVILNFGCNGNWESDNFGRLASVYDGLMAEYPERKFYVAAVYPSRSAEKYYTEDDMEKMNRRLKKKYGQDGLFIDAASFIESSGFVSDEYMRDELHYKNAANIAILAWLRKQVGAD